ncbi:ricin B lectin domain-containing protein [Mycena olivaceomarginata]|nr:ricin B lectin domain-containing protein [Mycena olivaceomarginata]
MRRAEFKPIPSSKPPCSLLLSSPLSAFPSRRLRSKSRVQTAPVRLLIHLFNSSFNARHRPCFKLVFNAGIQGCIAVGDNADGEPLIIHNCNTEDLANQDWDVSFFGRVPVGPQQIKIFGDKCIDVKDGVNADGTKLQIWSCVQGSKNQQWISLTDSTFQWSGTNKCIDLSDGKITDGNVLQLWTCDSNNSNQKWFGAPNPDTVR